MQRRSCYCRAQSENPWTFSGHLSTRSCFSRRNILSNFVALSCRALLSYFPAPCHGTCCRPIFQAPSLLPCTQPLLPVFLFLWPPFSCRFGDKSFLYKSTLAVSGLLEEVILYMRNESLTCSLFPLYNASDRTARQGVILLKGGRGGRAGGWGGRRLRHLITFRFKDAPSKRCICHSQTVLCRTLD